MALDRDEALMLTGILSRARKELDIAEDAIVDAVEGEMRRDDILGYVRARTLMNEFEERLPLEVADES